MVPLIVYCRSVGVGS